MRRLIAILAVILLWGPGCQRPDATGPAEEQGQKTASADTGLPLLLPMRGTGQLSPPQDPSRFTFVVFGDNRPGRGEEQPGTIKEIFEEIRQLQPAFALSLGDIIEGKPRLDELLAMDRMREQFDQFLLLAAGAQTPIFNAPGNHEMDDNADIPTVRMHQLYAERVGPLYGAFNYGNSRFITLNTEDIPPPGTPSPPEGEEFSYVGAEQLRQLKADLDTNRDKTHIFITMHYPIYALYDGPPKSTWDNRLVPESRRALSELFANYDNIAYVMAAHEHLYYSPQSPDDITNVPGWTRGEPIVYLVSGGAGAPLDPPPHGFHHYLVFSVDGAKVTVRLVRLQSSGAKS